MPSWEDGSERYLAEYRGETIYDLGAGEGPLPPEGDEMNAYANAADERRAIENMLNAWSDRALEAESILRALFSEHPGQPGIMYYYHCPETCENPENCAHCTLRSRARKALNLSGGTN